MKFLVTGVNGQLGYDIVNELKKNLQYDIFAPNREKMDITNEKNVKEIVESYHPDVIFHCAAYTAVDKAEDDRKNCYNVNVNGTKYLVESASKVGAKIVYISTDYVFDGSKEGIYEVEDEISPINYYGETKWLGEEEIRKYPNHIIARISWVFGINGKNFVRTMLNLALTKKELGVVCDQIGSPTYTEDLSKLLVEMVEKDVVGTYHITNEGYCSWYDFAKYIFEINEIDIKVNPVFTKDYKTVAKRPLNSKLSKEKLVDDNFKKLPSWQDAVQRYSKVLKKEGKK